MRPPRASAKVTGNEREYLSGRLQYDDAEESDAVEGVTMLTGTISDFDSEGLFGVIDADDGRLVLFNLRTIDAALRDQFRIGTRVEFAEQRGELAPRALAISPIAADA